MKYATRLNRLGTETAFAVGAQAAELAAQGKKVYPFHLGDLNIKTPENIIRAAVNAMNLGKTGYCPTPGIKELRTVLADDVGQARDISLNFKNVSIQPGGKPVIGKFIQVLMDQEDEVLYPNPGYPIYESMINYYGGKAVPYGFKETGSGFALDFDQIESKITPKTTIFIYNNYQNPMGASSTDEEMQKLADFCKKHDLYVLSDEAYFDMIYSGKGKSISSLPGMKDRTVILYTFSKKYAMTGWRLGAAIGPEEIIEKISKLNVNDESCSNHFVQYAGIEALKGSQEKSKEIINILKKRRDKAVNLLNSMHGVSVFKPECTFYLFPNVTGAMKKMGIDSVEEFRENVLKNTGVSFCTREHFGTPLPGEKDYYIRLAYSGINVDQIGEGLTKMKKFIESY
ncbi:aminotransferase class I/II-fold pyridoxal phosphate-dependent enzyme [Candidatus Woesearchaeota archaeon]|nr:aminotransferase class I/II-fold pyridoxal phosphate-dependent enzyme [Candidatus Woesearchaeota archaeon]